MDEKQQKSPPEHGEITENPPRYVSVLANKRTQQVRHIIELARSLGFVHSKLSFHLLLCGLRDPHYEQMVRRVSLAFSVNIYLDTDSKVCLRVQQRWQDLPSLPPCAP